MSGRTAQNMIRKTGFDRLILCNHSGIIREFIHLIKFLNKSVNRFSIRVVRCDMVAENKATNSNNLLATNLYGRMITRCDMEFQTINIFKGIELKKKHVSRC